MNDKTILRILSESVDEIKMDRLRFVRHSDIKFIGYGMLGELRSYYWIEFVARHMIDKKVLLNLAVKRIGHN